MGTIQYHNYKGNHWNKRHNLTYQKYSKVVKGFFKNKNKNICFN